jgi:hypothetical protein
MIRPLLNAAVCAALCFLAPLSAQAQYPPLTTEISPDHPLFIFAVTPPAGMDGAAYAPELAEAWETLPAAMQPYSVLAISAPPALAGERVLFYHGVLAAAQQAGIPVVLGIDGAAVDQHLRPDDLESLFQQYTVIRGAETRAPRFDLYPRPGAWPGLDPGHAVLIEWTERAARYGRFLHIALGGMQWPRMMAAPAAKPVYDKFMASKGYVIPSVWTRGEHVLPQQAALMGLWLEGATQHWGVAADARWYQDAQFLAPGLYGLQDPPPPAPAELYRLMLLNGAMGGACVYAFPDPRDLWVTDNPTAWEAAILPTLSELLARGAIARGDFVLKSARVACQLASAGDPQAFHVNLSDIDPVLDKGLLFRAAYGGEHFGVIPELSPNRAGRFWVPLLSAHAGDDAKGQFAAVVPAGSLTSPEIWDGTLAPHAAPVGEGEAFVAQVGRAVFVYNTRENEAVTQRFTVPGAPAPVRAITASREADAIVLAWPFRESDVSYTVLRRALPATTWETLVSGIAERTFREVPPDPQATYAYAITALTNETEPYTGQVAARQYLLLSAVESRVAEEVVMSPVLTQAQSVPVEAPADPAPAPAAPPAVDSAAPPAEAPAPPQDPALLAQQMREGIKVILEDRLAQMTRVFATPDIEGLLELYAEDYADPEGWTRPYVRRTFRWFFDHYRAPRMRHQVRTWNFDNFDTMGRVTTRVYVRLAGYAVSDASGTEADVRATLPLSPGSEVDITWVQREGAWRILTTNPALPNFRDLLSYSAGPHDRYLTGPDTAN